MTYWNQIKIMQSAGVSYFNYGTKRNGRKKLFDWYATDPISENQKRILESGGATIRCTVSEYAPELRRVLVCFDSGKV